MRIRRQGTICIFSLVVLFAISLYIINSQELPKLDVVKVNDFAKTIEEGKDKETTEKMMEDYGLNYYYLDGQLVVYSDGEPGIYQLKIIVTVYLFITIVTAILFIVINFIYLYKVIVSPFMKLKDFATSVAKGNLNAPLLMDKKNIFGAFTESFDIMREELAIAKENEKRANESKKELVASLSHDIKTPLASIKAINELLLVKIKDAEIIDKLHSIDQKTEQIEALVSNLFHATLEELEELKVHCQEISSLEISRLLKNADSNNRIENYKISECLVYCDPLRIQQVFDNVISNSYKYADSNIKVDFKVEYGYFNIIIEDYGKGVSKDELVFIKQKYYRGSNSTGKNGAGIGLYISNYFMEHMDGYLRTSNGELGFQVVIGIKLV